MKKVVIILSLSLMLVISAMPLLALAQAGGAVGGPAGGGGVDDVVGLGNPLGDKTGDDADPRVIIGRIIAGILGIVGSLALAIFILGGLTWMTSGGNRDKVEKGKQMIIWAVLGIALIFFSYAVVSFLIGAFTNK